MPDKNVLVLGGGVAGLSAALELASLDIGVDLVEKADDLGGHAREFSCKAVGKCVKCGACVVEEKLRNVILHPKIRVLRNSQVEKVTKSDGRFSVTLQRRHENASLDCEADAVILATGFKAFDPESKPYGYRLFENVITNLELEQMLKYEIQVSRPTDFKEPERIAFVQCVGSRDAKLNHLWCSKICCGSALRMARRIKAIQPETDITFFYIDVQTFGKDFQTFYEDVQKDVRMIRAIPGDIFKTEDDRLRVIFFDTTSNESAEELFDLVVLSVGLTPGEDTKPLAELFQLEMAESGFINPSKDGVFVAGTAQGPMSIAESVASAGHAVWGAVAYLGV